MKHHRDKHALAGRMLDQIGVTLTEEQVETLLEHLEWVLASRDRLNLTAVEEFDEALRLHVVDSLTPLPEVLAAKAGAMIDLGTGGGFPGIPLSVASGRRTVLLDSVKKKAEAVREFVRTAGLDIEVVAQRSEELALGQACSYSIVVARAVASLPVLVELAAPLLSVGGRLICLKGRPDPEEMERGSSAAAIVGLRLLSTRPLDLPLGGEHRELVTYAKVGESEVLLPRRPGRAQKKPLA